MDEDELKVLAELRTDSKMLVEGEQTQRASTKNNIASHKLKAQPAMDKASVNCGNYAHLCSV